MVAETHIDISTLPRGAELRELLRKCEPVDGGPALDGGKAALVVVEAILGVLCDVDESEIDSLDAKTVAAKLAAVLRWCAVGAGRNYSGLRPRDAFHCLAFASTRSTTSLNGPKKCDAPGMTVRTLPVISDTCRASSSGMNGSSSPWYLREAR
jgi:hypothetical protein